MKVVYQVTVQTDESGEPYIVIPPEFLDALGWTGDTTVSMDIRDGVLVMRRHEPEA